MIDQYGTCIELVSIDPHFHDVTIGLYQKGNLLTIWTYSGKEGVRKRVETIRNQICALGGLVPVKGSRNQVSFPCGELHVKPLKFLLPQVVEKPPDFAHPKGEMRLKDTRTPLTLVVTPRQVHGRWVHEISADRDAPKANLRLRAIIAGFRKYGEMEGVGDLGVSFACGYRHDALARLIFPFSRNVSAVEDMLESSAMRGQLTTGTAGFSPL